jgi:hypothetical protein
MHERPEKVYILPLEREFEPVDQWEIFCERMQQIIRNLRGKELTDEETAFLDVSAEATSQMASRWIIALNQGIDLSLITTEITQFYAPIRKVREDIVAIEKEGLNAPVSAPHPTTQQLAEQPGLLAEHLNYVKDKGYTIRNNKDLHIPVSEYSIDVLNLIMALSKIKRGLTIDEATAEDMRAIINTYSRVREER